MLDAHDRDAVAVPVQHRREVVRHALDPTELVDVVGDEEDVARLHAHSARPFSKNSFTTCSAACPVSYSQNRSRNAA